MTRFLPRQAVKQHLIDEEEAEQFVADIDPDRDVTADGNP